MHSPEQGLPDRLRQLCDRLGRLDDLRAGAEAVAWACEGVFPFYRVAVVFPGRDAGRCHVAGAWASRPEEELSGYGFSLRGHPLEEVVRSGATVVRTDPGADHADTALRRLYSGEQKAEEMAVALDLGGRRGLLVFASRKTDSFGPAARAWAEDVGRVFSLWGRSWAGPDAPDALREQYEALLEGALDGIGVLQGGRLVYSNASLREIFGLPPAAVPSDIEALLSPRSRVDFRSALAGLVGRARLLPRLEVEGVGGRRGTLRLEVGLQSMTFRGEPGVLIQIHDVTERAEREQVIREAYERVDAVVQTLAHDIRTPLTTIVGFSELLQRDLPPEHAKEALQVVCRSSRRLRELAEGLLEYSALGAATSPLADVATESVLAGVEEELQGLVAEARATLRYRRIPPVIRCRALELGRVFRNLVENAIRYSRVGGPPVVEVSCTGEESGCFVFCVEDNGEGVPPDRTEEVFRLFSRGDGGGAGVGLAIVDRVVRGHGGRVWLESRPGEGSRFYFTVPKPRGTP